MIDVIRSMTGLSLAMPLFGARQLGNLLLADSQRAVAAFDDVVDAARRELDENLDQVFRAGERWQSEMVEWLVPDSRELVEASLWMLERSAATLRSLPGQERAGRELANKTRVFGEFQYVESRLILAGDAPLTTGIEKAFELDSYRRLWALEGLGFARAERAWRERQAAPPRHDAPPAASIPLHTGLGLSLAMRTLGAIDSRGGDGPLAAALERFGISCAASSAPGRETMAFEGLGLVVRTLHPHLLYRVDRLLAAIDPDLVECYWHSVGRALYFAPTHVLPGLGGRRRALEKAFMEPPHETGKSNALAGFAWAVTLVNFRHPEVLASLLRDHGDRIFDHDAFAHGVSSASLIWYGTNGREANLEALLGYRCDRAVTELWKRLVTEPIEAALRSYPALEKQQALGTLFRYRPAAGGRPACADRQRGGYWWPPLPDWSLGVDGWVSRALQALNQVR